MGLLGSANWTYVTGVICHWTNGSGARWNWECCYQWKATWPMYGIMWHDITWHTMDLLGGAMPYCPTAVPSPPHNEPRGHSQTQVLPRHVISSGTGGSERLEHAPQRASVRPRHNMRQAISGTHPSRIQSPARPAVHSAHQNPKGMPNTAGDLIEWAVQMEVQELVKEGVLQALPAGSSVQSWIQVFSALRRAQVVPKWPRQWCSWVWVAHTTCAWWSWMSNWDSISLLGQHRLAQAVWKKYISLELFQVTQNTKSMWSISNMNRVLNTFQKNHITSVRNRWQCLACKQKSSYLKAPFVATFVATSN